MEERSNTPTVRNPSGNPVFGGSLEEEEPATMIKTSPVDPFALSNIPSKTPNQPIIPLIPIVEDTEQVQPVEPVLEIPVIDPNPAPELAIGDSVEKIKVNKMITNPEPFVPDYESEPNLAPPGDETVISIPVDPLEVAANDDAVHYSVYSGDEGDYDPIKANGEYFVGWKDPELVLVFTGQMDGYLEPCGCAGMAQMKGGLSRRLEFFNGLHERNWPIVAIDSGNLCKGSGRQEELKFHLTIEAYRKMQYGAIAIAGRELKFSVNDLISVTLNMKDNPSMFTSANVAMMMFDPEMTAPFKIIDAGKYKIGITSVVAESVRKELNNPEIVTEDAKKRLEIIVPEMRKAKADLMVLMVDGTEKEATELARAFPDFKIIVPSESPSDPPNLVPRLLKTEYKNEKNQTLSHDQYLIEVGEKGKFAVVLGLFNDPKFPVRYQRIALDSRYENSPVIIKLMENYQEQLKNDGFAGLGIKDIVDPQSKLLGGYIGSKSCETCHPVEYETWRETRHASAWKSLTDTSNPPRNFDPECIACHVVGWEPESLLPYTSGYHDEIKTRHLLNVGCENCHGPGEVHAKLETPGGGTQERIEAVRKAIRPQKDSIEKLCIKCHDLDNSPAFDFKTYWPKVSHNIEEE